MNSDCAFIIGIAANYRIQGPLAATVPRQRFQCCRRQPSHRITKTSMSLASNPRILNPLTIMHGRRDVQGSWGLEDDKADEAEEEEEYESGLEWEEEEEVVITPDDSRADVQLRPSVQDILWKMPQGEVSLRLGYQGAKPHHRVKLVSALVEKKVVAVEISEAADLEKTVRELRGNAFHRENPVKLLGTLSLSNKYILLFGESDFVSTLVHDPFELVNL